MSSTAVRPAPPADPTPGPWTAGRVAATVVCAVVLALGSILVVAGVGAVGASGMMRGDGGLYTGDTEAWSSPGYAVRPYDTYVHGWMMGDVEVTAASTAGKDVFVGLARTSDVERYLDAETPPAPTASTIWVTSSSGPGTQTLTWPARSGHWSLVVMNADGSRHVSADVTVSAELPVLAAASTTVLVAGVVLLVAAGVGLVAAIPRTVNQLPTRSEES